MSETEREAGERLSLLLRVCGRRLYHSSCAGRTQARVLRLHYLEGLSFQAVSARLLLDLRWVRRLHEKGLDRLEVGMGFDT